VLAVEVLAGVAVAGTGAAAVVFTEVVAAVATILVEVSGFATVAVTLAFATPPASLVGVLVAVETALAASGVAVAVTRAATNSGAPPGSGASSSKTVSVAGVDCEATVADPRTPGATKFGWVLNFAATADCFAGVDASPCRAASELASLAPVADRTLAREERRQLFATAWLTAGSSGPFALAKRLSLAGASGRDMCRLLPAPRSLAVALAQLSVLAQSSELVALVLPRLVAYAAVDLAPRAGAELTIAASTVGDTSAGPVAASGPAASSRESWPHVATNPRAVQQA
jgi:hypothetical protein